MAGALSTIYSIGQMQMTEYQNTQMLNGAGVEAPSGMEESQAPNQGITPGMIEDTVELSSGLGGEVEQAGGAGEDVLALGDMDGEVEQAGGAGEDTLSVLAGSGNCEIEQTEGAGEDVISSIGQMQVNDLLAGLSQQGGEAEAVAGGAVAPEQLAGE